MKALLFLVFLLITIPASARLGEDKATCEKRYGTPRPVPNDPTRFLYIKGQFQIFIQFDQAGFAEAIGFSKNSGNDFLKIPLTDIEITTLLQANLGHDYETIYKSTAWSDATNTLLAEYDPADRTLILFTNEVANRHQREQEAAQRKALEGF